MKREAIHKECTLVSEARDCAHKDPRGRINLGSRLVRKSPVSLEIDAILRSRSRNGAGPDQ